MRTGEKSPTDPSCFASNEPIHQSSGLNSCLSQLSALLQKIDPSITRSQWPWNPRRGSITTSELVFPLVGMEGSVRTWPCLGLSDILSTPLSSITRNSRITGCSRLMGISVVVVVVFVLVVIISSPLEGTTSPITILLLCSLFPP